MRLLIDPPVGPFSPPAEIRAWLQDLAELRERYRHVASAQSQILYAETEAQGWLAAQDHPNPPPTHSR